jgi:hypothetical protein
MKMVARPRADHARRYVCATGPSFVGCGKTYVLAEPLERLVAEAVLHRLDSPALMRTLAVLAGDGVDSGSIEQELQSDRLQLDELAEMYGLKEMTAREWTVAKSPIQRRIADNEHRLSALTGSSALDGYLGNSGALRSQWESLTPPRRRAIVAALLESITIGPGTKGRNIFDPARVTPAWKA